MTGATGAPLDEIRAVASARSAPLHVLHEGGSAFTWPDDAPGAPPGGVAEASARLALAGVRALTLPGEREAAALDAAIRDPDLPARRERFSLPEDRTVLLDGAHNPSAAAALAAELPSGFHALLGVAARKDAPGVQAAFDGAARLLLVALNPAERPWGDAGDPRAPEDVLDDALAGLPAGGTLVVTGSFYLAGRLRSRLRAAATRTEASDAPGYARRS